MGNGHRGRLGLRDHRRAFEFVEVEGLRGVVNIAMGDTFSLFLKAYGRVFGSGTGLQS
jgi:alpha-tubulin suppressor-like RCC1 family protein